VTPIDARPTLYLDAPSLAYRAFFGVPLTITNDSGQPVNAVRGYLDMLATILTTRGGADLVSVFDRDWRPQFRVDAYPGFKKERPEEPEELTWQFGLLNDVLDALGLVRVESPGLEADDAIATLVAPVADDERAFVVTGDRDLLCLVRDPNVRLLFTVKGVRELKEFDEAEVESTYGIPPKLYIEFAMMRGDPSDGLPGVPGIGPKTAVKLLDRYGSLDEVLEHLVDLPPKQSASFDASRDYLQAMRIVVPPVTDAPIERTTPGPPDEKALSKLARVHNLDGPIKRFLEAVGAGGEAS
jgi:5'-3' exonuclease